MRAPTLEPVVREENPTRAGTNAPTQRPAARWVLVGLLGLLVISGFYGGWSFITDRTGAGLGAKLSWLDHTPVTDFFLPGLFLFGVYGVGGLVLIAGLISRRSPGPLARLDGILGHHWAWAGSIVFGAVLVLWIVYELFVLPETMFLQPMLIVTGLAICGTALVPSVRRGYSSSGSLRS